jgi:hypothetical protein
MIRQTLHRLAFQRAVCKTASVVLVTAILVARAGGMLEKASLPWVGGPLILLLLMDAVYAAESLSCWQRAQQKGGDDSAGNATPEPGRSVIFEAMAAVVSISIWPFYGALLGGFLAAAFLMPVKSTPSPASREVQAPMQPAGIPMPLRQIPARAPLSATPSHLGPMIPHQRGSQPPQPAIPSPQK